MAGDLVTGLRDASHQPRGAAGHPAEHEEGAVHLTLGEQREQALGVGLDPILARGPAVAGDDGGERGDVKVILDVDRERVDLARRARRGRGQSGEAGTHGRGL